MTRRSNGCEGLLFDVLSLECTLIPGKKEKHQMNLTSLAALVPNERLAQDGYDGR